MKIEYQYGFNNYFQSQVIEGILKNPNKEEHDSYNHNTPRQVPYNLYTEQLSGTAFTAFPRLLKNRRTWLYRVQPSVVVGTAVPARTTTTTEPVFFGKVDPATCQNAANPLRWNPLQDPPQPSDPTKAPNDFIQGMTLMCTNGDPATKTGLSIYMYAFRNNMSNRYFMNSDGEFLLVPQRETLHVKTELGRFRVAPTEVVVIPRGIVFQIDLIDNEETDRVARGYVLEVFSGGGFQLPELGPIVSGQTSYNDLWYSVSQVSNFPLLFL